ncbi:MAG: hypothetical protein ACYTEO_19140 [Planctomycetota bacterium]|jgi:hypothetical protein
MEFLGNFIDPDKLYVVVFNMGYNTHWGGIKWENGVAGPVSAHIVRKLKANGRVRAFEYKEDHVIKWVRRCDIWDVVYTQKPKPPAPPRSPSAPPEAAKKHKKVYKKYDWRKRKGKGD